MRRPDPSERPGLRAGRPLWPRVTSVVLAAFRTGVPDEAVACAVGTSVALVSAADVFRLFCIVRLGSPDRPPLISANDGDEGRLERDGLTDWNDGDEESVRGRLL